MTDQQQAPTGANTPKTFDVVCPSGLRGAISPMRVRDIAALTSGDNAKGKGKGKRPKSNQAAISNMLASVWQRTDDGAIYTDTEAMDSEGRIRSWHSMLNGDRVWLLNEARRVTFGDEFHFRVQCQGCGERLEAMVDMTELKVTSLSQEAIDAIRVDGLADAQLRRTLPISGVTVGMRLLRGVDAVNVEKAGRGDAGEMNIAGLLARLVYIEGLTNPGDRREFVQDLHLLDMEFLREEWETADITVQDEFDLECADCGHESRLQIPIDASFFSARSARPKRVNESKS